MFSGLRDKRIRERSQQVRLVPRADIPSAVLLSGNASEGPLWVKSGNAHSEPMMSAFHPNSDQIADTAAMSASCHVWTAPSWQVLSSRLQAWSVQPCVRPTCAVHMTAGHNALRGSGPGHNLAFDNALAQVGCPDRRIDRLRITCCSPSQPSHHAGCPARSCYAASATGCL